jgi:Flp pilus assembly protein TadG
MAESAIAMALALMVFIGIVECGRALYTYHAVANAARLGSRYAIVRGSTCSAADCPATSASIRTYVRNATPMVDQSELSVDTTWATSAACTSGGPSPNAPGCLVSVQVTYPFQFNIPLVPLPQVSMTSTSQMLISQ